MKPKKSTKPTAKVKVLYQYLNGRWYAFADMDEEIYFGKVPVTAQAKTPTTKTTGAKTRKPARKTDKAA